MTVNLRRWLIAPAAILAAGLAVPGLVFIDHSLPTSLAPREQEESRARLRETLAALARVAPVTAVRGNNDREGWAAGIPETEVIEVERPRLYRLATEGAGMKGTGTFRLVPAGEGDVLGRS